MPVGRLRGVVGLVPGVEVADARIALAEGAEAAQVGAVGGELPAVAPSQLNEKATSGRVPARRAPSSHASKPSRSAPGGSRRSRRSRRGRARARGPRSAGRRTSRLLLADAELEAPVGARLRREHEDQREREASAASAPRNRRPRRELRYSRSSPSTWRSATSCWAPQAMIEPSGWSRLSSWKPVSTSAIGIDRLALQLQRGGGEPAPAVEVDSRSRGRRARGPAGASVVERLLEPADVLALVAEQPRPRRGLDRVTRQGALVGGVEAALEAEQAGDRSASDGSWRQRRAGERERPAAAPSTRRGGSRSQRPRRRTAAAPPGRRPARARRPGPRACSAAISAVARRWSGSGSRRRPSR